MMNKSFVSSLVSRSTIRQGISRDRSAGAVIYYVDASGGSDSNNGRSALAAWQTIAKVNAATLLPGESVLFKRGEVWSGTRCTFPSSGTLAKPIVIGAYGTGANPLFDATTRYTDWTLHSGAIYKRQHISAGLAQCFIDGTRLKYSADVAGMTAGSWCFVSEYVYVWASDGGNPNSKVTEYSGTNMAIALNGKSNLVIDGIDFYRWDAGVNTNLTGTTNITIKNCVGSWGCREFLIGVDFSGVATNPSNVTIQDCIGHDDLDVPFWIGHGTNLIVERCTAYNNGSDTAPHGTYPSAQHFPNGILVSADAVNCIVRNNYLHHNYCLPALIDEQSLGARSNGVLIYGNKIDVSDGTLTGVHLAGANTSFYNNIILAGSGSCIMCATTPTNIKIFHNTLISPSGAGTSIDTANQVMTSCLIRNNIIVRAGATGRYISVALNSKPSTSLSNNLYYGASTGRWFWGPTEYASLATWQAACGSDSGSLIASPAFVTDYTNLHLQSSSPARNAGADLGILNDYDGVARVAPPDIGAYEYVA